METILRILAFTIGGGVLTYLALLYFGSLYAAVFPGSDARQIAPMQTIVDGKVGSDLGPALSQMLLVHLGEIRQELEDAARALQPGKQNAAAADATLVGPAEGQRLALLQDELPNRLQESFTVQLTVGGVELSGVANWVLRQFNSAATMRIVIETIGTNKNVYGNFDPAGVETFVIRLKDDPSHDAILEAIAHRIAHRSISRSIPQLGALRDKEFKELLTALSRLAGLNRQISRGREPAKDFDEVLTLLDPLTAKVRSWTALARITGEVAERASNLPRAKELYQQAMAATKEEAERQDLQIRIARVDQAIATAGTKPTIPVTQTATTATPAVIPDDVLKPLLTRLGVPSTPMPNPVRIAIIGGAPPDEMAGPQIKIVGAATGSNPFDASDYFVKIMNTVNVVAPKSEFIFSRRVVTHPSDAVQAIQDVLLERPNVLLLPIRGADTSPVGELLKVATEQNIVTVLSAGNDGVDKAVPFAGSDLLASIVVTSAVDDKGIPAQFTQRDAKSFWAPGVNIPVGDTKGYGRWSGTGPAAALAAGVIARVLSERPNIRLSNLLDNLRAASRPLSRASGAPPVLDAGKTLELTRSLP